MATTEKRKDRSKNAQRCRLAEFCIPAYNEEQVLRANSLKLLDYLNRQEFPFDWRIVLIINGSSDRTWEIAGELAGKNPRIKAVNMPLPGRGRAQREYFSESRADLLFYMDADLSVSLETIPDLIAPIMAGTYDLVIGSRLLPGARTERSFVRELASQSYNSLSRLILGHRFTDLQCGFKVFRTDLFKMLEPNILDDFWFFDTELVLWAQRSGYRIKEIPVDWRENRYDKRKSKIGVFRNSWEFLENLLALRRRIRADGAAAPH